MNPDVWIWLGDVAYVDKRILPGWFIYGGFSYVSDLYEKYKKFPEYVHLRENVPIIGVWDDHDYGVDNGNKHFPYKDVVKKLWLDFIDEPKDSPRWTRAGMYDSCYIGDPSKIKVILLDVRYFRDRRSEGRDMLGDAQWDWLDQELKNNKAEYIVIGTGTQVFPDERVIQEHWYAESRDKLLSLIRKHRVSRVILITGDVHFAEILKFPCKEKVGYDLYEFTSSGITHHVGSHYFLSLGFVRKLYPDTYSTERDRYTDKNFGVLRFNFKDDKGVTFQARNEEGKVVLEKKLSREELEFKDEIIDLEKYCVLEESPVSRLLIDRKSVV